MQSQTVLIGAGDIARRVAALLTAGNTPVVLAGRRCHPENDRPPLWREQTLDLDRPESLQSLPLADARILYLAPPPAAGCEDTRMRTFCATLDACLPQRPRRIVYISTSGVYGDCGGALVDESRPPNPQTDRARRRLDAERVLQGWGRAQQVPVLVLRVAGIYGPGRLPLQRLRDGLPVLDPDLAPSSNRIHADDLARVCLSALQRAVGGVINVCDGAESSLSDYFLTVARVFGLPRPQLIDRAQAERLYSTELLSYLNESRRLDNRRMREALQVELLYPDLAAGLQAIRDEMQRDNLPQ